MRHADASRISCAIVEAGAGIDRALDIRVEDDGKGLAVEPARRAGTGIGLAGMRERVEALSGTLDLATSSAGTRLTIYLPAPAASA